MIVPGSRSQALAAALATTLDDTLAVPEFDRFPDGETFAAVPAAGADTPERAVVVAATPSNDAYVELLQLQDALREAGVESLVTVIPYMGYARQDKVFEPGQPISARAMARAVSTSTDRVVLVTPHEPAVREFFDVPVDIVDAADRLAVPLAGLDTPLDDPLFLSPDDGAIDLARAVRDAHGAGDTDYFEKTRHSGTEVSIEPSDAPVEGRDVVITDDIIATGSTMAESVAVLRERGADRIFTACVHPLLARAARTKLEAAGVERVYGTDTLERDVSVVSAAPVVADVL
ncbi:ribose-phosphate diphosphokinase [Salinigranum halophilum]|uniref:ribose-phosphate diphosphokinase n=1 Tax=Salinigranum halophilum TaxID=2565931 RepID=UPI0010A75965|nr:ribose-phosphate diphosphokinase [Salinigranum halophilum]